MSFKVIKIVLVLILSMGAKASLANTLNVIMGGFNSCGLESIKDEQGKVVSSKPTPLTSDMHGKLFEEQAKGQISISQNPYIVSCHDMSGNIYYIRSDKPDEVIALNGTGENFEREMIFKKAIEDMFNDKKDEGIRKVNLVGHSHGGWLAMTMAEQLDKEIPIQNLYTIDPISKVHCGIREYSSRFFGSPHPDCTRYPRDFDAKRIKKISKRVQTWKNYWQDETAELHSSEIPKVENIKMRMTHTGIDNSDYVWNCINEDVSDMETSSRRCFVDAMSSFYTTITTLMLPSVHFLVDSNGKLTGDDKIDPMTIRKLNELLARGDFSKVEEFILANPKILDYEEFDLVAQFNLARFFEQRRNNKPQDPNIKQALKLYAQSMNRDLSNLSLDDRAIALDAQRASINRILAIYTATPEKERGRDDRAKIEYWQGKLGDVAEQIQINEQAIERRNNPRNNQGSNSGSILRGLFR